MLNEAIDQLPKRLMMVIRVKGGHVKFHLDYTMCVNDRCCFVVCRVKIH